MIWILYALLALLIVFLAVILTRACLFKPKASAPVDTEEISVDNDRAADHLAQMIRVKTVSHRDDSLVDWERFSEFPRTAPPAVSRNHLRMHHRGNRKKRRSLPFEGNLRRKSLCIYGSL